MRHPTQTVPFRGAEAQVERPILQQIKPFKFRVAMVVRLELRGLLVVSMGWLPVLATLPIVLVRKTTNSLLMNSLLIAMTSLIIQLQEEKQHPVLVNHPRQEVLIRPKIQVVINHTT